MKHICKTLTLFLITGLCACNYIDSFINASKTCENTCPPGQKQNEDCSCYSPKKSQATDSQQKEILLSIVNGDEQNLTKLVSGIAPDSPFNLDVLQDQARFKSIYAGNADISARLTYQKDNLTLISLLAPLANFNEAFNTLLNNGADPNMQAFAGETPLEIAVMADQGEKVKMLLKAGAQADFESENNILEQTLNLQKYKALHALSAFGKEKQISFRFPSNYFTMAMIENNSDLAKAVLPLTEESAINRPNSFGTLPLVQAAFIGNKELMTTLIESGASLELKDQNFRTPVLAYLQEIYIAKIENNFPVGRESQVTEIVKHFLEKGADINAKDNNGENIMFYAVRDDNKSLIDLLITTYKQDINTRNNDQETPLFIAAQNYPGLVPFLISKGANPKVMDKNGRTPAIAAAEMGNMDIYDFLESAAARRL